MKTPIIDLRSDTVTRPTPAMREAMASADVDDDVIDVDPTVARLQELTAELLGKEAAIFMPSGTMTNQAGVRLHCRPGDEFICEEGCHIYNYEQGAYAQLSGLAARPIIGDGNLLKREHVKNAIRARDEHCSQTRLLCLENTHNRGGGKIHPYDDVVDLCNWAHDNGLATHLDGARLFNAVVASGISAADWSAPFDTVSVCFSKGLGAPVGSALAGSEEQIAHARYFRKLFGGGMRQAGIIAAGALFALENNIDRLAEDHANARRFAERVAATPGLHIDPATVDTNIAIFRVDAEIGSADAFQEAAESLGVRMFAFSHEHVRAVTHYDVSGDQIEEACDRLEEIISACRAMGK